MVKNLDHKLDSDVLCVIQVLIYVKIVHHYILFQIKKKLLNHLHIMENNKELINKEVILKIHLMEFLINK